MRSVQESFNRKLIYNPSAQCICSWLLIIRGWAQNVVVRWSNATMTSGGVKDEFLVFLPSITEEEILLSNLYMSLAVTLLNVALFILNNCEYFDNN